jgi:hypothetical protein
MSNEAEFKINPRISSLNEAANFTRDIISKPPQSALEMVKIAASAFGVSGVVSAGIGAAFPLALPVLPLLQNVFDLFGSNSGPTLNAIGAISQQIAQGIIALEDSIQKLTEETQRQSTRTIENVLTGVNQIALEQSAVNVFKTLYADNILYELEAKKTIIYDNYINKVNAARGQWLLDVQNALEKNQKMINAQYEIVQKQLANIAGGLFGELSDKLRQAADDAQELLEIQRQIDEINQLINDGALPVIAKSLITEFYGLT